MNIPTLRQLKGNRSREICIKTHYPEFYNYIIENYTEVDNFQEKLYWHYNGIKKHPKCKYCGKDVTFMNLTKGYHDYCSIKCSTNSKEVQEKTRQTNLNRYGDEVSSRSAHSKDKAKRTCMEKYGVDNAAKSSEIKEKMKQTCMERYGVGCVLQDKMVQDKIKTTCREKYGMEHYNTLSTEETKIKIKKTKVENFIASHPDVISVDGNLITCKCQENCELCKDRTFTIPKSLYVSRNQFGGILCTKLNKKNSASFSQLELFVTSILKEYNIDYINKDREQLNGKELDIYIPKKRIAIECNGCFWHNSLHKPSKYHYEKFQECQKNNIQLISLWEDWIKNKPVIVRSLLLSKLGIYNKRIYARNCQIREVDNKESSEFLNKCHIQGNVNSSIRIGLYYNNALVSLMTFGQKRKCVNGSHQWELYRYCSNLETQVVGGAQKLFQYFIRIYKPVSISSFSSNDISNGNLYKILGFQYSNNSLSYWYIHQQQYVRKHRYLFTKKSLIKDGYDESKTEEQIMFEKGYWRIWDSGQAKWVWMNQK